MNPIIKEKWLKSLRSGEYEQGQNQLKAGDFFCCLGVLTDLYVKEKGLIWGSRTTDIYGGFAIPQPCVIEWAGLKEANPRVVIPESLKGTTCCDDCESLTEMNDQGYTFDQIADVIEEQL